MYSFHVKLVPVYTFFSLKRQKRNFTMVAPCLTPFSRGHMTAWRCCGFYANEADNEDYRSIWKITSMRQLSALPSQVFCANSRTGCVVEAICCCRHFALSFSLYVSTHRRDNEQWKTSEWRERQVQVGSEPTAHTVTSHPPLFHFPLQVLSI